MTTLDNEGVEKIKHNLTEEEYYMLRSLEIYLEQPLHFYGSIKRRDYFRGKSDIDVDIFTDNEQSTVQILSERLNIPRSDFKRIVNKVNDRLTHGYKAKYKDADKGLKIELSIYNNKYKPLIVEDHKSGEQLSPLRQTILTIVKFIYYQLHMLPTPLYVRMKRIIFNDNDTAKFIMFDV